MVKLLFATQNQDKLAEARRIVSPLGLEILSPQDLQIQLDKEVEETGTTLAQNAYIKATSLVKHASIPIVGEDTGLFIRSLPKIAGVHSNRWFPGSSHDRNLELLKRLKDNSDKTAEFRDVLCLLLPNQKSECRYFIGVTSGTIATELKGKNGFGYDPLFMPDGLNKSYAELTPQQKDLVSHRAKAWRLLAEYILTN